MPSEVDLNSARAPTEDAIRAARQRLGDGVLTTPVTPWVGPEIRRAASDVGELFLKLELFQRTGSFKARGALLHTLDLDAGGRERGVCAVSAGNHAIAVAYAAQGVGTHAKVVMLASAPSSRVEAARWYGAEVLLEPDGKTAFDRAQEILEEEGRTFIHPFEGPTTVLGTSTVGMELCDQIADLDAVIVPIGGGGLCSGIASAVKQIQPRCSVYGVEPVGADSMHRSFASGSPQEIESVTTIADSLGAPHAAPYTYALCKRYVDELVLVDDDQLRSAMRLLAEGAKLAVEPAGAASTAALCGPLAETLRGKRVALIVCGANLDWATYAGHLGGG